MKREDIAEAVSCIDEDIIDSAEKKRAEKAGFAPRKGAVMQRKFLVPVAAMAACAVIAVGAWSVGYRNTQDKIGVNTGEPHVDWTAPSTEPPPSTEPVSADEPILATEPVSVTEPTVITKPVVTTIKPEAVQTTDEEVEGDSAVMPAEFEKINAVALARYPKMAPYPTEELAYRQGKFNQKIYDRWNEDYRVLREASNKIPDISGFYNATAQQFLTNSNGENRVYSPLSIYVCLAMLAETTDGNSRKQILDLLECENIEALRENVYNVWNGNYRNDGAVTTILANSIWLNDSIAFKQPTLDTLAEKYYASSFSGDMAKKDMTLALRAWLNLQTGGLLEESVEGIKLDRDTIIALCNTVYFCAKWDWHFLEEYNDTKVFHSPSGDIETEFMNKFLDGYYYWSDDYGAVALDFDGQGGRMWLILPDEDKTVDDILNSGEYLDLVKKGWQWKEWEDKKKYININLSVPKFDVTCDTDLIDGLKELGVTDVFDENKADFSSLSDFKPIFVGQAQHSARVVIDEEGCTAAAFTVMPACEAGLPPDEEIDFVLDRPFVFVIDNGSGQPLFTGVVNVPKG